MPVTTPATGKRPAAPKKLTLSKKAFEQKASKLLEKKVDDTAKLKSLVKLLKEKGYAL